MDGGRVPAATYRLQFNSGFTFRDAKELVPYLHRLGISDIYASPMFQARAGSTHGYDVTDPTRLNRELGTEGDFDALVNELKSYGMGLVLDIVPNHMAAGQENPWWRDVLEHGPTSSYAVFFDIQWHRAEGATADQLVLPILGRPLEEALTPGELVLTLDDDGFNICYYDRQLPLEAESHGLILRECLSVYRKKLNPEDISSLRHTARRTDRLAQRQTTSCRGAAARRRAAVSIKQDKRTATVSEVQGKARQWS